MSSSFLAVAGFVEVMALLSQMDLRDLNFAVEEMLAESQGYTSVVDAVDLTLSIADCLASGSFPFASGLE